MRLFLLFLNLAACILSLRATTPDDTPLTVVSDSTLCRYDAVISTAKGDVTGLLILRKCNDDVIGSLINEFGFSILDFKFLTGSRKLKLLNISDLIDKWYIRRVIKSDLTRCICLLFDIPVAPSSKYETATGTDGGIKVINLKQAITYSFSLPNSIDDETSR